MQAHGDLSGVSSSFRYDQIPARAPEAGGDWRRPAENGKPVAARKEALWNAHGEMVESHAVILPSRHRRRALSHFQGSHRAFDA